MTTATAPKPLCFGRPHEWWETGDGGNRLAIALCKACPMRYGTECHAGMPDPSPVGVIRAGIPYSDNGAALPLCPSCGYPNTAYRGGKNSLCATCQPPTVSVVANRQLVTDLFKSGVDTGRIAARIGAKPAAVKSACVRWNLNRATYPAKAAA